ncbi:hypothetical protein LTR10_010057 [Elasticomyces elasticus]|nr:hypothetical protein LTR10_010057 [Elasticomyces elasticus]KAK4970349.1 hypothetical protein LTR42_008516 [Elasticomyces elasticus]
MFFRVADRIKEERRRNPRAPLACVSLGPAEIGLTKEVCTTRYSNTNPQLWEQFQEHLLKYSVRFNDVDNIRLRLCHPTKPDPGAAVFYIRQHMGHLSRSDFEALFQRSTPKSTFMYILFRRTADTLREKGLLDDASYVKQRMEDLFDEPERERLDQKYLAEQYSKGAIRKKSNKAPNGKDDGGNMASSILRTTALQRLCYCSHIARHAPHRNRKPGRAFSRSHIRATWKPPAKGIESFRMKQSIPQAALTPAGIQLHEELLSKAADPVAILRERLGAGSADLEAVRVCLDAYYKRLKETGRNKCRQKVRDDAIGRLALQWLWSDDRRWVRAVTLDVMSLERICYVVTAEGFDHLLVEWLTKPLPPLADESTELSGSHQWRGAMLRHIVESHLFLDCDHRADEAIERYFSVLERVIVARRAPRPRGGYGGLARLSWWPAQIAIMNELSSGQYYNTKPDLYNGFVKSVIEGGRQSEYACARLALAHPSRPNAQPALSYFRTHIGVLTHSEFQGLFPHGSPVRRGMYFFLLRLVDVMIHQNRGNDNEGIIQVMTTMFDQRELTDRDAQYQREARLRTSGRRSGA